MKYFSLFLLVMTFLKANAKSDSCFYLDKSKITGEFATVHFFGDEKLKESSSLRLESKGLFDKNKRICRWSLNGGSGTKDRFSLDAGTAAPILDPNCEKPFSHITNGNGFGDWYLTLCGTEIDEQVISISLSGKNIFGNRKSLDQWTSFPSGKFPIKGSTGD